MATATEVNDYLAEIRQEVCSRCVEKPPGGPPCAPLGKACGIEMHLPQLIESIHQIHSPFVATYLEHNREEICSKCAFLHSSICPCPMDYLSVLLVDAVEAVNAHRARPDELLPSLEPTSENAATIAQVYQAASGSWTGCDWPMEFGQTGLDLRDETAQSARAKARQLAGSAAGEDWRAASEWLGRIEIHAAQAEARAAIAVKAAAAGHWEEALDNAEWTWTLEFITGRPLRRGGPSTWKPLRDVVKSAYCEHAGRKSGHRPSRTS